MGGQHWDCQVTTRPTPPQTRGPYLLRRTCPVYPHSSTPLPFIHTPPHHILHLTLSTYPVSDCGAQGALLLCRSGQMAYQWIVSAPSGGSKPHRNAIWSAEECRYNSFLPRQGEPHLHHRMPFAVRSSNPHLPPTGAGVPLTVYVTPPPPGLRPQS